MEERKKTALQKRRSMLLFLALLFACIFWGPQSARVYAGSSYTGWKTIGTYKYYYRKGVQLKKGWRKISGDWFYFNSRGQLQRNTIAGAKTSGYYYVDPSGRRVTDKRVRQAVSFVMSNSKSAEKPSVRLQKCFKALLKYGYRSLHHKYFDAADIEKNAYDTFRLHRGDCVGLASAFAYIARVLGYDVRLADGGVTAYQNRSLSNHTWCEVKTGNTWKMVDCTMQRAHRDSNLYLVTRSRYPFRLRCDATLRLVVSKGKISWK